MNNRIRLTVFTIAGSSVILITLLILFFHGIIRFNYPSRSEFPIRGIDISHHQGEINWSKLKKEKLTFIIIKATEGGDFVDHKFGQNADSALSQGYRVGAYHFYRLCRDGKSQARHFINSIKHLPLTFPPSVDIEFGGNCKSTVNRVETIKQITEFLDTVESVFGTPPIIYATQESYKDLIKGSFMKNPVWIRDIFTKPELSDNRTWKLWQFANRGRVNGISGYVDINVFRGHELTF